MTKLAGWLLGQITVGLIWCLHFLPLSVLSRLGQGLGWLAWHLVWPRRRIALINLAKCFPQWSEARRKRVARAHFLLYGRFVLEHGLQWWAPFDRLDRLIQVEGIEHLEALRGQPVILLAPHFLGLDIGGTHISRGRPIATMYQSQRNKVLDHAVYAGRDRYAKLYKESRIFWYRDGLRAVARAIKQGVPFYVLPDMDLGARDSVFAPFFGIQAATVTSISWLARITGAHVVPCVTRILPGGQGYLVRLFPPWEDYPSADPVADATRMNAFIEQQILEQPEQYYWLHKRFKTRPPGEASFYA